MKVFAFTYQIPGRRNWRSYGGGRGSGLGGAHVNACGGARGGVFGRGWSR